MKIRNLFYRILFAFPIIFLVILLFGFSVEPTQTINKDILFDTCIEYVKHVEKNSFNTAQIESNAAALSNISIPETSDKELQNDFVFSIDSLLNKSQNSNKKDSLTYRDSLKHKEWIADSTARFNLFKYNRVDKPYTLFRPQKQSSFFAQPTNTKKRTAELDSTGQYVIIKEEIGGIPTRPDLRIPLSEYISLRQESLNRDLWEDIGYKYELKEGKKDLSQLLTDITNIDIPLPSVSFLSIFGPPKINLKINGAVDIHGAWKTETTDGLTASRLGNTRSEPDFKQTVQIGVNGTIGDKLTISADWNTERTFEYENMLKIKYTGYEDEMIQSIEAGNVSLQTSSLVGGSEALFGLKAQFKFGPLSLTALASQKKGEIQEMSVSGGSRTNQFEVRAYEYSKNHFFIHEAYADTTEGMNIFYDYYGNATPKINQRYTIREIQVWKTITGRDDPKEKKANAFIDLPPRRAGELYNYAQYRDSTLQSKAGKNVINGRFVLLTENVDYTYNQYTGFISLKTGYNDVDAIAVAFRLEGNSTSPNDDEYYGEFISENQQDSLTHLVLRLVKPPNLQPNFKEAWKLQLKNIYSLKGRDIKKEGFKLDIKYQIEGQEPVNEYAGKKLLNAFELDMTDVNGTSSNPDGLFDFFVDRTIIPSTGEIIFPRLQPFGTNLPAGLPREIRYQSIYDTTDIAAKNDRAKDKFTIVGEYSASVSSTYNIGFNVVENSVKVLLNGRELSSGSDYSVDYNTGQVVIRNDAALVPGADLRITYEQNDLFSLASKTLVGLRGLYEFSKRTKLGFSFLNLNQQTLSDKVRIGEEPSNNSIFGVDFETSADLPFVTKALDKLFSTSAMSSVSFKGEFAYMSPDPNTKKSTISSDQGKSIAYIDDFEGSKRIIPIGVTYTAWKDLSPPDKIGNFSNLTKAQQMSYKGKSFWYNILPSNVDVNDIWPNKQVSRNDQQITVLDYYFKPGEKGTYNYTPNLINPQNNWGGMMKLLSSSASDLTKENIEYIEFWLKIDRAPTNTKIYIDLGRISEDIIPNNKLDTEDKVKNGLLDEGEDTGIDGVLDFAEPDYSATNPDPSGDNFRFVLTSSLNPNDYANINGTQGNGELSDNGRLPDTEDLNNNGNLDVVDSYFRYEISLDTSRANNPFIAGGGDNAGWYLYKVPLKDHKEKFNDPSFSLVEYIRLWVTGAESDVHIRLAEFNLVGNQWQKVLNPPLVTINDDVLTLSTINIEDNPEYYSPPGVFRERDKSKTEEEVLANEQSLLLKMKNLKDGDKREIVKYLSRPLNVFYYKEMKLFVHGDLNNQIGSVSNYNDENDYASEVYFRFGADSLNFYEYRQPVKAGWNEIRILFNDLTALKQRRNSDTATVRLEVPGVAGHFYSVKGNPTLTRLQYFTIGVLNPKNKGTELQEVSGDIWVNELRVLEADDTPGWAYTGATSFKFADILNVNVNASRTDPNFHKLSDRFGTREDRRSWGVMADLDVIKILPVNLPGSSFRLNYQRTESLINPVYLPNTDIKISEAAEQLEQKRIDEGMSEDMAKAEAERLKTEAQTLNVSDTWSLSNVQIKIPSTAWYIRDTFNALSFSFNFNKSFSRSPSTLVSKGWEWSATAKHNVNLSTEYFFYPVKLPLIGDVLELFKDYRNVKIYYSPQSITSNLTARRNYRFTQTRVLNSAPSINRDFTSSRNAAFVWKITEGGIFNLTLNYSVDIQSTYSYLLTDEFGQERPNSAIWKDIFTDALFGKDLNYKQSTDFKLSPKMPTIFDLNKYFSVTAGYTVSYNWENRLNQQNLGRSAGYSNSISAGMTLRWKSLWDPLFKETNTQNNLNTQTQQQIQQNTRGRQRDIDNEMQVNNTAIKNDSLKVVEDSLNTVPKISSITKALAFLKSAVKYIFFDYEQITFNFKQSNAKSGSGIAGEGTGFNNFWGIKQRDYQGPSRMFMLGFSNDIGPRAPNGNLTDNFRQTNSIDFKTSRPLWEGATIDVDWRLSWDMNKTTNLTTDSLGNINITNVTSTGKIERSFFSMPPTMFLSVFKSGIKRVNELYNPNAADANRDLADAFVEGFESFSLLGQVPILNKLMKYVPRPNWRINWNGLEKYAIFKNLAKRVSFNHAYQSSYSEGWKINPDGLNETQSQRVMYGFQPLAGLNFTFNSLWNGDLIASAKFSTKTTYDLGISTKNITESFQRDINITASYKKSGFEIPLFGIALKNDIEISLSYTMGKTSTVKYDMRYFKEEGEPTDGSTRTTIEPRLKYVMSSKVTLSLFYTRTSIQPEGASPVPATTTNVAGLDIHIAIQ